MTRWDERWRRASEAAEAVGRIRAPVVIVAVAVVEDLAAALDVSGGAARLLLLRREAHGFVPWAEPIVEPLKALEQAGTDVLRWIVGPVKVTEGDASTWAVAGLCAHPSSGIRVHVGSRSQQVEVRTGFFAALVARVPADDSQVVLSGMGPDGSRPLWSLPLPAANLLTGSLRPSEKP